MDELTTTTEQPQGQDGTAPAGSEATPQAPVEGAAAAPASGEEQPPAPRVDDRVPYRRFREVQTEATGFRRELDRLRPEYEQLRGTASTLQEQIRQAQQELEDHRAVASLLRDNPDLYDQLRERVSRGESTGARRIAQDNGAGVRGSMASLDPETTQLVREAAEFARTQRERDAMAERQRADDSLRTQLREQVTGLLEQQGYKPTPKLVKHVESFIISEARSLPGMGSIEDVPYLFNEWYGVEIELDQMRRDRYLAGKKQDRQLPPSPSGGAPVQQQPQRLALSSAGIKDRAIRLLRERGWGAQASG